jgi:hypothetical protein
MERGNINLKTVATMMVNGETIKWMEKAIFSFQTKL